MKTVEQALVDIEREGFRVNVAIFKNGKFVAETSTETIWIAFEKYLSEAVLIVGDSEDGGYYIAI